jgi:excisionase family DNA binding protein
MKVSYSMAKGRASPHCITWIYRKKRHRKYFRSRIDALRFRNEKEQDLGVRDRHEIENEIIFWALSEIKERLDGIEERIGNLEANFLEQGEHLKAMRKPPAPKVLRVAEAAKVLRVSSRKLYYLLDKGVFKRYKLPHTRTTFIKLEEVEKALGAEDISELLI